ncbi:MAG: integrase core domain-containing protein [Candidatus Nitrotoga sp.]|nr:integrase core domain-containing protein [Candidatus Nitrotoga sp.]MDO9448310.1 integrase core domain-containing protein [Candidatus Nitrotoga sp.]MDP3496511.1 integrase core domain-containing protein [Candidatus Nitrotoga sp.]
MNYLLGFFDGMIIALLMYKWNQSMNRPSKVTDNAFMESFFHSMKADVIHGNTFSEDGQLLTVLRSYFPFYNHSRMHSSLNYESPATYENQLT